MGGPRPLLLLLGVTLVADHVTGQALQLTPNRTEHVRFANTSLFISCKGQNPVDMAWKGPNGERIVQLTGRVRVEASKTKNGLTGIELLLSPIKRSDSGRYKCTARVNGEMEEASFNLIVYEPIAFDVNQQFQYAAVGDERKELRCDATGKPKPSVSLRGLGRPLVLGGPNKKYEEVPNGLVIRNITRQDGGIYVCKASHVNKQASDLRETNITLTILYGPEWTGPQQSEVYGFLGGSANLSCQADAEPHPTFSWLFENESVELQQVDTDYTSVLQIPYLNDSMFGDYTCIARKHHNDDGISRTIALKKGRKPAVPQVTVTKTEGTRLTLSIRTAPEEDQPDTYRAEYRTEDATWASATAVEFQPGGAHVISNLQPETVYVVRVAALNRAGRGDFSAGLRQKTAAASTGDDPSANSSQPLMLSLLVSLLTAALLVL